jgi:hypothetical protein
MAVPAFLDIKEYRKEGFEPFSMQKHVLFRLILVVNIHHLCVFGCASLYRLLQNNCGRKNNFLKVVPTFHSVTMRYF